MAKTLNDLINKSYLNKTTKIALSNILVGDYNKEPTIMTDKGIMDVLPLRIVQNRHTKQVLQYLHISKHSHDKYITKSINKEIMRLLVSDTPYRLYLIDGLYHRDISVVSDVIRYFKQRFDKAKNKTDLKNTITGVALVSIGEENDPDMQIGTFWRHITLTFNHYFYDIGLVSYHTGKLTKLGKKVVNTPDSKIDKYTKAINYHPLLPYSTVIKRLFKALKNGTDSRFDLLIGLTFADQLFNYDTNEGISDAKINGKAYKFLSLITSILITLNLFSDIAKGTPLKADDTALQVINNIIKYIPSAKDARQQVLDINKNAGI